MSDKININTLKDNLSLVIQNEISNMRLLQDINKEFVAKGLNLDIPMLLFDKGLTVHEIKDENVLIALAKSIFNFAKTNNKDLGVNINPTDYFTDTILTNYEVYQEPKKPKELKKIVFEDCQKVGNNAYWFFIKAKQLAEIKANNKLGNFEGIQRARKIVKLPNGEEIEKINVNKDGINALTERFKKHNIKPTCITFTVLDMPNKEPKVDFISEYKNFGRLEVTPNFDSSAIDYTPMIINDGNHRSTALSDAYFEDSEVGDEGLGVFFFLMSPADARQYTADTFEQNTTDTTYAKTLKNTPENRFIQYVTSNSKILKNKVANIITECKVKNSLTYLSILNDTVNLMNIEKLENDITSEREARKISNVIDMLIDYLTSEYFNDDIEKIKEHNFLLKPNMFVGYLAIANTLKNNENSRLLTGDIADKLMKINEDLNKKLKLDIKDCNTKHIYEYFEKIAKEVM